jgi:hypothetical protein
MHMRSRKLELNRYINEIEMNSLVIACRDVRLRNSGDKQVTPRSIINHQCDELEIETTIVSHTG